MKDIKSEIEEKKLEGVAGGFFTDGSRDARSASSLLGRHPSSTSIWARQDATEREKSLS